MGWRVKRRIRQGTEAVVINSAEIDLVPHAAVWADPRRGTATKLLNGVIAELLRRGGMNEETFSGLEWRGIGPALMSGRIADIAVDPDDRSTWYVAVGSGGSTYLAQALVVLAIVSMTVGNLAAIAQKDFNRLMAYSSIAHAGYVLIGILCMDAAGYAATIFYALSLMLMKFTCFLVLVMVAGNGGSLQIGCPARIAERLERPVVADFRRRDLARPP